MHIIVCVRKFLITLLLLLTTDTGNVESGKFKRVKALEFFKQLIKSPINLRDSAKHKHYIHFKEFVYFNLIQFEISALISFQCRQKS